MFRNIQKRNISSSGRVLLNHGKPQNPVYNAELTMKIEPIQRTGESIDVKRARLVYQSRKRGSWKVTCCYPVLLRDTCLDSLRKNWTNMTSCWTSPIGTSTTGPPKTTMWRHYQTNGKIPRSWSYCKKMLKIRKRRFWECRSYKLYILLNKLTSSWGPIDSAGHLYRYLHVKFIIYCYWIVVFCSICFVYAPDFGARLAIWS